MSQNYGPKITTDGLVLCLDAANPKSFPKRPEQNEHGISDWIAMDSGTATYSAIYPNTRIYEVDSSDNETLIVTTGSDPQRGTFSVTAGNRYYGSNPIHIIVKNGFSQHKMVPLSLSGTTFGYRSDRNTPGTLYLYSLYSDATVSIYDDVVGGINGTATSTVSVPRGTVTTFSVATTGWVIFTSDYPIVASATQAAADMMVLTPASTAVYRARDSHEITVTNTVPSTISTYYVTDSTNFVVATEIGDGAGSDSAMSMPLENMSDTYSFGEEIADFEIIAPYPNTVVNAYYWSGTEWILGESFSLNGTLTTPAYVARDGDNGFGVDATNLTGSAVSLASAANLWKFDGNNPFTLYFNDNDDDEELMFGWMSNSIKRKGSNQNITWYDLSGNNYNGILVNNPEYNNENKGTLEFNGINTHIIIGDINDPQQFSIFCVLCPNILLGEGNFYRRILTSSINVHPLLIEEDGSISFRVPGHTDQSNYTSGTININEFSVITAVYDQTQRKIYKNGLLQGSQTIGPATINFGNIGLVDSLSNQFDGKLAVFTLYNRALTDEEISQNFQALKGRFDIL